jgi:Uma2 family endonuclease
MPTRVDAERTWTVAELDELPDDGLRYELVDGNLLVSPPPPQVHQWQAHVIAEQLRRSAPEGWWVVTELTLPLGPTDLRIPDVVVHRWPLRAAGPDSRNPLTVADVGLLVEVVSPRTRKTDRFTKPGEYAEAGVGLFWRIETDPALVLHAFALDAGVYRPVATIGTAGTVPAPWGDVRVELPG